MVQAEHEGGSSASYAEGFERVAPALTERTRDYWTAGADGVLRIARCAACGQFQHPPRPVCSRCRGRDIRSEPVTGRGVVWSWTVNRYQWQKDMPPPYVLAEVELVEQAGLRLLTNIVDCAIDDVGIGLAVEVCFVRSGEAFIPLFRPVAS
jgi:uncharacterized protein